MAEVILYMYPGACSRVTMTALEETGIAFEDRLVNVATNAQMAPEYLVVHKRGKVPALAIDGRVLIENAAILYYLNQRHPEARLLPPAADAFAAAQSLGDLLWCSSTLHPEVRQVRAPFKWTEGDPAGVKADGIRKFSRSCEAMSERLSGDRWWYGQDWSIVDTYLYWTYSTAAVGGFPLDQYPVLLAHAQRVRARPAFQRARAREVAAVQREGLPVKIESL